MKLAVQRKNTLNFSSPARTFRSRVEGPHYEAGAPMIDSADRVCRSLLVVRCQGGDRAAFKELIELHQQPLHYFISKMVGNSHVADDLTQEVWFDVFRNIARL